MVRRKIKPQNSKTWNIEKHKCPLVCSEVVLRAGWGFEIEMRRAVSSGDWTGTDKLREKAGGSGTAEECEGKEGKYLTTDGWTEDSFGGKCGAIVRELKIEEVRNRVDNGPLESEEGEWEKMWRGGDWKYAERWIPLLHPDWDQKGSLNQPKTP